MTGTGLTALEVDALRSVFARHPEIERVILFGSRAKGASRKESDIDLAVCGTSDDRAVESLAQELDDLPLPYRFDVKALERIRHASLLDHIERVGKSIDSAPAVERA